MDHIEIERKWMPERLPEGILAGCSYQEIEQGYLCTEPALRVRRSGERYILTYKGAGSLIREEYNLPLTKEAYETLLPKASGIIIRKTRYLLPLTEEVLMLNAPDQRVFGMHARKNGLSGPTLTAEIDCFHEDYEGLIYIEVEFPSEAAAHAFQAPTWFGREVSDDPACTNAALSRVRKQF